MGVEIDQASPGAHALNHLYDANDPPALTWLPVARVAPTALKAEKELAAAQEAEAAKEKEEDDLEKLLSL